jgi:hypothetical protein
MKTWGVGGWAEAPPVLAQGFRWVISFTPLSVYPQGKYPCYPLCRRLGGWVPGSRNQILYIVLNRLVLSMCVHFVSNYWKPDLFNFVCWQDGNRLYVGAVGSWYWQGEYSSIFRINTRHHFTNFIPQKYLKCYGILALLCAVSQILKPKEQQVLIQKLQKKKNVCMYVMCLVMLGYVSFTVTIFRTTWNCLGFSVNGYI